MSAFHSWYPVSFSKKILKGKAYPVKLLNEPLVIFRDQEEKVAVLQDRCPHRSTPLSLGKIHNGNIECPYHGWQFNGSGICQHIPSLPQDSSMPPCSQVLSKSVIEKYGMIWVYSGKDSPLELNDKYDQQLSWDNNPETICFEFSIDLQIPHELMIENLLDPSHLPFTHDKTISKRSKATPLEMNISKKDNQIQGTTQYKSNGAEAQTFIFDSPCSVYFDLQFKKSSIRQVHYCIPTSPNSMRVNSIFYYRNMNYLKFIPFVKRLHKRMAKKIVYQDLAMLSGQDQNLKKSAKPWNQAVSADKLALAYRQWLNKELQSFNIWFNNFNGS